MSWERRSRGTWYYTRSLRRDGRVIRQYIGTGPLAELIAAADAEDRCRRAEARAARLAERTRLARIDALIVAFDAYAEAVARAALMAAGFHRHHRGAWRKRRCGKDEAGQRPGQARAEHGRDARGTDGAP